MPEAPLLHESTTFKSLIQFNRKQNSLHLEKEFNIEDLACLNYSKNPSYKFINYIS